MIEKEIIENEIRNALKDIVDPGAGLDVFRMGLVRDLQVCPEEGKVSLVFRPSSPVCPIAFTLAPKINDAVLSVNGVRSVDMRVENFNRAQELEALLKE